MVSKNYQCLVTKKFAEYFFASFTQEKLEQSLIMMLLPKYQTGTVGIPFIKEADIHGFEEIFFEDGTHYPIQQAQAFCMLSQSEPCYACSKETIAEAEQIFNSLPKKN